MSASVIPEIKNCEQLIQSFLRDGRKVVSCNCKNLLSSGENYGSTLLSVEVTLLHANGEKQVLQCVAKTPPPTKMLWEFFNTKVTFKKEIAVYNTIVPLLNEFGRKKGIQELLPFFAKCYGSRESLNTNPEEIDQDAVLLLENLKTSGYQLGDRFKGFDRDCTELILKDLSTFHASPIAYKLENPEKFEEIIKPHLKKGFYYVPSEELFETLIPAARRNPHCAKIIYKLGIHWKRYEQFVMGLLEGNDLFATIVHHDYWTNNTMLKHENGRPIKNAMLDFQLIEYGSPAHDLIFFLYSSVDIQVLENHLDDFFKQYYDNFVDTLWRLNCDVTKFSYEAFMEEVNFAARMVQLTHLLYMLFPSNTLKGEAKDLTGINKEADLFQKGDKYHDNFYMRLHFILLDFNKRGWLD